MYNKVIISLSGDKCKNEAVSRFFGSPTIPGEWFDDAVFSDSEIFVCQIALADFTDYGGYGLFPKDGYIYLFFDLEDKENPVRIRFFADTPDTVVEDFNDGLYDSPEYSVRFYKDGEQRLGESFISSAEPDGEDIILFDFTSAPDRVFSFLNGKKKIKISKNALSKLYFGEAKLI